MNAHNSISSALMGLVLVLGLVFGGCEMKSDSYGCHAPAENGYQCVD